jgi:hypothetical protein
MSSTSSTVTSGKQASKILGKKKTSKVVSPFADPISCFLFLFFLGELAL